MGGAGGRGGAGKRRDGGSKGNGGEWREEREAVERECGQRVCSGVSLLTTPSFCAYVPLRESISVLEHYCQHPLESLFLTPLFTPLYPPTPPHPTLVSYLLVSIGFCDYDPPQLLPSQLRRVPVVQRVAKRVVVPRAVDHNDAVIVAGG